MDDKKAWKKFQAFFVFFFRPGLTNPGLPKEKLPR